MQIINQNILEIESGIITHQVNCKKVMGAGLALKIKKKWPIVFKKYKSFEGKLGDVDLIEVGENLFVANLYGQEGYGKDKIYTNYDALRECFKKLKEYDKQIYIPHAIGCGLGGGDWNIVCDMLEKEIPTAILCKYNA